MRPHEVLEYLRPEGGWYSLGSEYEDIVFSNCKIVSKNEYMETIKLLENKKQSRENSRDSAFAKLAALGLTEDEIAAL